eukprot:5175514-Pyramimonas_sp.AAC.1
MIGARYGYILSPLAEVAYRTGDSSTTASPPQFGLRRSDNNKHGGFGEFGNKLLSTPQNLTLTQFDTLLSRTQSCVSSKRRRSGVVPSRTTKPHLRIYP